MAHRLGLGEVRHLALADLWVQQRVKLKDITVEKVLGTANPSDAMTMYLAGELLRKCVQATGWCVEYAKGSTA